MNQAIRERSEGPTVPAAGSGLDRPFAVRFAPHLTIGVWVVTVGAQLSANRDPSWRLGTPTGTFWFVVLVTGLCILLALAVLVRAVRSRTAETALFGSFLIGASALPFVHGLLVPGVLYGPNDGTVVAVMLAVPVGSIALSPWLAPNSRWSTVVVRRWRLFVGAHLCLVLGLCVLLLVSPNAIGLPPPGSLTRGLFITVAVSACALASWRQVTLTMISRRPGMIGIAFAFAFVGSAPLTLAGADPFGAGFWLAHGLDAVGILLAGGLGLVHFRRRGTVQDLLEPLEVATPLRALEVGLDPLVHRFVADLDAKDPVTRDHVIRTSRYAVRMAMAMRLAPAEVRSIGIAAILHDVGKLEIPDEILNKPGALDDEEFAVMRTHAVIGAELVAASGALDDATALIRGHHERWDGGGYPDGLAAEEIPLGARVVSVCDSFDAMSQTRQYRQGMTRDRVRSIMIENAGTQWDEDLVRLHWSLLDAEVSSVDETALDEVGRGDIPGVDARGCCVEDLPILLLSATAERPRAADRR